MVEPGSDEITPPPTRMRGAPAARAAVALATMALVIAAAALLGILLGIVRGVKAMGDLEAKVQALEATQHNDDRAHARLSRSIEVLENAVTLISNEQTDLGNSKLQQLRNGLAVSELQLERQDTAVMVAGRIVNATSLRYRDATFRLKVGNSSKEFTIASLGPGSSGRFEVVLPNLAMEKALTGTFSLVSSAIEFAP